MMRDGGVWALLAGGAGAMIGSFGMLLVAMDRDATLLALLAVLGLVIGFAVLARADYLRRNKSYRDHGPAAGQERS